HVTRTAWALNSATRMLRAEVDLPNPDGKLLPGMYADAKVIIERPGVRALPLAAVALSRYSSYCWTYQNGRAVQIEIETGANDGQWIEVIRRRVPAAQTALEADETWIPFDGSEPVILGDLSTLKDGAAVRVEPGTSGPK